MMKNKYKFLLFILVFVLMGCSEIQDIEIKITEQTETSQTTYITTEPYNPLVEIDFSFLGDCTLATQKGGNSEGTFNWYAENYPQEYFFEKTYPFVCDDDFTIANCENVFTDNPLYEREKGYSPAFWFKSPTVNASIFPKASIEVVSLANNHTFDYGEQGMLDTIDAIESTGQLKWGNTENDVILEKDGVKIGLICGTMWYEWQGILDRLEVLNQSTDIQIVFFHGGEEAVHSPESWKIQGCKEMVDAGADLIIGGHPHVLQPMETYNDVNIVYSIGNFCFGGNRSPENRTIIYQEKMIYDKDLGKIISRQENIIPFYVFTGSANNYQPAPIDDEYTSQKVLDFMYNKSSSPF